MSIKPILDSKQIRNYIPHRPPFLFVDAIMEMDEKRVVGRMTVTADMPLRYETRDSAGTMPPILVLEAVAQVSGVQAAYHYGMKGKWIFIIGFDGVKISRAPEAGETVFLEAHLLRFGGKIARVHGRAYVEDESILEADITASVVDLPDGISRPE
jgi:3-hydroxyacyl-[acyl-carrier-protein] dehydratase